MAQIPILSGIYCAPNADFRTRYPRNLEPVPKKTGISEGFLRPADGIVSAATGPGIDRGSYKWNEAHYRVMGSSLVRIASDGAVSVLGDVGPGGTVTMDNGFDQLAIWSGGGLYYYDGSLVSKVTDSDLGVVIDGCWIGGYFMSTDGTFLIVTELNDPYSVNPLKYGSSESDPDPIVAVRELRDEAIVFNRYTIEVFQNLGGDNFPFQRIDGAQVPFGAVGTHAVAAFAQSFAFVGNGKNDGHDEPVSVYVMGGGTAEKIATAEVEQILMAYSEEELASVVLEAKSQKGHQQLLLHLPDQCLVYDLAATKALGEAVWFTLDSGLGESPQTYRARHLVWVNGKWWGGDPTSSAVGYLSDATMQHFGSDVAWDFGSIVIYNESNGFVINSLELIGTPGRVSLGADPTIWWSYSLDGETWSQARPLSAGKQGERLKRLQWRKCGSARNYRMERFHGTSAARIPFARLEATLEALNG